MEEAETYNNGDSSGKDVVYMKDNKGGRGRDAGWWRWRKIKNKGDNQVDNYSGIRNSRWQGRRTRMAEDTMVDTRGGLYSSRRDIEEIQDGGDNKIYAGWRGWWRIRTKEDMRYDKDSRDNISHNVLGNSDSVTPGVTTTTALMDPSLSPTKERPTNKRPAQHIRRAIEEAEMVSWPGVSDTVFQQ